MYEVKQIEGKGLGFVAVKNISKGSLILKETPQMPRVKGVEAPNPKVPGSIEAQEKALKNWVEKVISLFNEMNPADQEEYMTLHNGIVDRNSSGMIRIRSEYGQKKADEILKINKIIDIYAKNNFQNGLSIKTSRLNHSCKPNAVNSANAVNSEFNEVRAIRNIKAGQEITISYKEGPGLFGLWTTQNRQEILLETWGFACICEFCQESNDDDRTKIQSKIQVLIKEVENLQPETPEKCSKMIATYKKLYKLGKKMKAPPTSLYAVLKNGYQTSRYGYRVFRFTENYHKSEEFKKDSITFSNAAEAFAKVLGTELFGGFMEKTSKI